MCFYLIKRDGITSLHGIHVGYTIQTAYMIITKKHTSQIWRRVNLAHLEIMQLREYVGVLPVKGKSNA